MVERLNATALEEGDWCAPLRTPCLETLQKELSETELCTVEGLVALEDCVSLSARPDSELEYRYTDGVRNEACRLQLADQCSYGFQSLGCSVLVNISSSGELCSDAFHSSFSVFEGVLVAAGVAFSGLVLAAAWRASPERRQEVRERFIKDVLGVFVAFSMPGGILGFILYSRTMSGLYVDFFSFGTLYANPTGLIGWGSGMLVGGALITLVLPLNILLVFLYWNFLMFAPTTPPKRLCNALGVAFVVGSVVATGALCAASIASESTRGEPATIPYPVAARVLGRVLVFAMLTISMCGAAILLGILYLALGGAVRYILYGSAAPASGSWGSRRTRRRIDLNVQLSMPSAESNQVPTAIPVAKYVPASDPYQEFDEDDKRLEP